MTQTNNLTNAVLRWLNYSGFKAWRNNNGAVYSLKRKAFLKNRNALLGVSDIIGIRKRDGKFLAIEIKTGKDITTDEQKLFLEDIQKAGGIGLVVKEFDQFETEIKKHQ